MTTGVGVIVSSNVHVSSTVMLGDFVNFPSVPYAPTPSNEDWRKNDLQDAEHELRAAEAFSMFAVSSNASTTAGSKNVEEEDNDAPWVWDRVL